MVDFPHSYPSPQPKPAFRYPKVWTKKTLKIMMITGVVLWCKPVEEHVPTKHDWRPVSRLQQIYRPLNSVPITYWCLPISAHICLSNSALGKHNKQGWNGLFQTSRDDSKKWRQVLVWQPLQMPTGTCTELGSIRRAASLQSIHTGTANERFSDYDQ